MAVYGTAEVLRMVNLSYRQLDYWTRKYWPEKLVGTGSKRLYTQDDVDRLQQLRRGFAIRKMKVEDIIEHLERCTCDAWDDV